MRWHLLISVLAGLVTAPVLGQNVTGAAVDLTADSVTQDAEARISQNATTITYTGLNRPVLDGTQTFFSDVLIMGADGSNRRRVTYPNDAMQTEWSSLSPDGSRVVFQSWNALGTTDIWMVDVSSSAAQQLTTTALTPVDNGHPTWSPDGSQIAFLAERPPGSGYQAWVMKAQPEDPTANPPIQITNWTNGVATGLRWAPDGRLLLEKDTNGIFEIYHVNADGSGLTKITSFGTFITDPSQPEAGAKIFFRRMALDNHYHVFNVKEDGSGLHQVTAGDFDEDTPCAAGNKLVVSVLDPRNGVENYDVELYTLTDSSDSGNLSGTFTVGNGQPASGATVSFMDGSELIGTAATDSFGRYSALLPPGGYTVEFQLSGATTVLHGAIVPPGGSATLDAATSIPQAVAPACVIPTISGGSVSVRWPPAPAQDAGSKFTVAGYNVYRSSSEVGPWTKVTANPVPDNPAPKFVDASPGDLASAYYAVTTVVSDGVNAFESAFSSAGQAANNLAFNPSFEIDSGDSAHTPIGWGLDSSGTPGCTWGSDTAQAADGAQAAYVQAGPADSTNGSVVPGTAMILTDADHLPAVKPGEAMVEAVSARYLNNPSYTNAYLKTAYGIGDPPASMDWTPWDGAWDTASLQAAGPSVPDTGWTFLTNPNIVRCYEFQDRTRLSMLWDVDQMVTPSASRVYFDDVRYQVRRIGPTGIVMGRIQDASGRPIGGVTITGAGISTSTDPCHGTFALRDAPTGPLDVTISMPGRADDVIRVPNYGGYCLPQDYTVADLGSLPLIVRGTVRYPDGTAAAGATVRLVIGSATREETAVTAADGSYSFGSVTDDVSSADPSTLVASQQGWISASVTAGFGTAGWCAQDLTLVSPAKGDVNADGSITTTDAAIALRIAAGIEPMGRRDAADVANPPGNVDLRDAVTIARLASGLDR